ncbi:MAG: LLM class F420-dependent oxidoreductase [Actinomycetota bacterium]
MDKRFGLTVPFVGAPLASQRDLFADLGDLGYTDLWSSEADAYDAFTALVLASQWAPGLRLGTAIVPVFTRGAAVIAQSAAALSELSQGRFVLGLGSSSDVIVERWNSVPFEHPYRRVRDTARYVRAALTGEKVTADHETIRAGGFRLGIAPSHPVPIMLAALRPGMLRLAGQESDGAIITWLSPDDVRTVVPYVHAGGPDKEIVARIFVLPTGDADAARALGRRMIAQYLTIPVYGAFHDWLGRGETLAPMSAAWKAGDRKAALAAIPDAIVDELIVHGAPSRCHERIDAYVEAGVTTPVLYVIPFGDPGQAVRDVAPATRP